MTGFESIRGDLLRTAEAIERQTSAVQAFAQSTATEIERLWEAVAELRDEHHEQGTALSNRIEAWTRGR